MTRIKLIAPLLIAVSLAPLTTRAEAPTFGRRLWYGVSATAMNILPIVSVFASQRCLPGYIACKLSFAGMGLVASGTQLVAGGDIKGARRTAERAFGGDWVVLPKHLANGTKPDPYPELADEDEYLPAL